MMPGNKIKKSEEDSDVKLREVRIVQGPVEAEVIKSLLESHGIKCILKGLVVQSVHAFSADGLGQVRIMVSDKDYEIARQLIQGNNTQD
jgi:ERCC4-related helicase